MAPTEERLNFSIVRPLVGDEKDRPNGAAIWISALSASFVNLLKDLFVQRKIYVIDSIVKGK